MTKDFKSQDSRDKLNLNSTKVNESWESKNRKAEKEGRRLNRIAGAFGALMALGASVATFSHGAQAPEKNIDNLKQESYVQKINREGHYETLKIEMKNFIKNLESFLYNREYNKNTRYSANSLEFYQTLRNILLAMDKKEQRYLLQKYGLDLNRVSNLATFYKEAKDNIKTINTEILEFAKENLEGFLNHIEKNNLQLVGSFDQAIYNGNVFLVDSQNNSNNHIYIWKLV